MRWVAKGSGVSGTKVKKNGLREGAARQQDGVTGTEACFT
jgi:hypothetical protein